MKMNFGIKTQVEQIMIEPELKISNNSTWVIVELEAEAKEMEVLSKAIDFEVKFPYSLSIIL